MKRVSKVISTIICITMIVSLFAGCTADEIKLLDALKKTATIYSMESQTKVSMELNGKDLTKAQSKSLAPFINAGSGSEIIMNTKMSGNSGKTISKTHSDINYNVADIKTNFNMWTDYNKSAGNDKNLLILQLPKFATTFVPYPAIKKYWVLNVGSTPAPIPSTSPSPSASTAPSSLPTVQPSSLPTVQPSSLPTVMPSASPSGTAVPTKVPADELLSNLFYDMALKFNFGSALVKKMPNVDVNGKSLEDYQISLDDKTFKDVLTYLGTDYADNKEVTNLIKNFLLTAIDSAESTTDTTSIKKSIEDAFTSFQTDHTSFSMQFNSMMDSIKNINILGEKGIKFDFMVDENGYVVNTTGVIDLSINLNQVQNLAYGPSSTSAPTEGSLLATINFSHTITKINGDVTVTVPTYDASNSFDMMNITKFFSPVALKVNTIGDNSTSISGVTDPNATVSITIYDANYYYLTRKPIVVTAKADGKFSTPLKKKITKGTDVFITADNDYTTSNDYLTVKDKTAPKVPTVYPVKSTTTKITGKAEAYSTVYVKRGNTIIAKGKATYKSTFSIKISTQKAKTVLTVYLKDAAGNTSVSKKITVSK